MPPHTVLKMMNLAKKGEGAKKKEKVYINKFGHEREKCKKKMEKENVYRKQPPLPCLSA